MGGILVAVVAAGFFLVRKPKVDPTITQMPVPNTEGVEKKTVVEGEVREIEVSGDEYSYSPSSFSVKKGEKVRIAFTNTGSLPHNLAIDEFGVSTKTILPGRTDTVEFTAEADGEVSFYCNISNHRNLGMEGMIEIEK